MLALVAGVGALIAAIVLATFSHRPLAWWDIETARTMTFTALVAQEYLRLVAIRIHERASLLANRWLLLAVGVSLALQLGLLYSPVGELFDAVPLGLGSWAVIGAGAGGWPARSAGHHPARAPPVRPALARARRSDHRHGAAGVLDHLARDAAKEEAAEG